MRHHKRGHLLPCARLRQEVFQQVVRKATIVQRRVSGRRNGIGCAHTWLQLREFEKAPIDANVLELTLIVLNRRAPRLATNAKDSNLSVLERIWIGHAKDPQRGKVGAQYSSAVAPALKWDPQNQDAFHSQPAVRMFKKQGLHTSIPNGSDLGVIRRVEVQQGERFGLHKGVESVPLDGLDAF